MNIVQELKTRNVIKVAIAYAAISWILVQLIETISDYLALPAWTGQVAFVILIVGFIPAMVLAWTFEITTEGVKLDTEVVRQDAPKRRKKRKLDYAIIGALALALAVWIWKEQYEGKIAEVESMAAEADKPSGLDTEGLEAAVEIDPNAVAVLPFANRSSDPNDVYFTDGIHGDLITQLSKIKAFHVISRTSVLEYRDTRKSLPDIAAELGVAYVMEGSVQKFGDRVRVNVQLIDPGTTEHLWAEIYDRELTANNLFSIQSGIAQAIATALEATLTEAELAGMDEVPTENVEAYDLYLQARRAVRSETRGGFQEALELYEQALQLDPLFKLAWIGLARAHISNYWLYGGDPAHAQRARDAIDQARAIDSDFPELYMAEGFYWYWGHLDYDRALYNLEKAIAIMPGNAEAHMWHGWASRRSGLWDQGLVSMRQSLRLDPRVSYNWAELGGTYLFLHRFDETRLALNQSLKVNPDDYWAKSNHANLALLESGDVDSALTFVTGADKSDESSYFEQFMDTHIYARRFQEALDAARQMPDLHEVQRDRILLREIRAARILHFMDDGEAARNAANAALFRLKNLGARLGEDFRVDLANAMLSPILDESKDEVRARVRKSMASRPNDRIQDVLFQIRYARIFAMAGMAAEAMEELEPLLSPPSETTVHTVDLDPAFDRIRHLPEFVAMLDAHR